MSDDSDDDLPLDPRAERARRRMRQHSDPADVHPITGASEGILQSSCL